MTNYNVGFSIPLKEWIVIEEFLSLDSNNPDNPLFDNVIESIGLDDLSKPIIIRNDKFFNSNFKNIDFLFLKKKDDNTLVVTSIISKYYDGPPLNFVNSGNKIDQNATLYFSSFRYKANSHIGSIVHKLMNIIFEPGGYVSFQKFMEECPQNIFDYFLFKVNLFNE
jgi:hypothetical protein